jgi:hypothetical protein
MPTKAKAASTSNDDVKPTTRASTSSMEDSRFDQIMSTINQMTSRFEAVEARLDTIEHRLGSLENASIQALALAPALAPALALAPTPAPTPPAPAPIVTPIINPSTSFKSTPFRADKVGYFDPDLDTNTKGDMVIISKDLWFRDVFLFTDRLKDIVTTKADVVRANWIACLRGTTLSWYQDE